jgi:hypothetical protein
MKQIMDEADEITAHLRDQTVRLLGRVNQSCERGVRDLGGQALSQFMELGRILVLGALPATVVASPIEA